MASLPHYEGQTEMFEHEAAAVDRGRSGRGGAHARLSEQDLTELADLVAGKIVAALPSRKPADRTAEGNSEVEPALADNGLMTADEIATRLGVKPGWVYRQSRAGLIPTVKLGRYYRYRRDAIERWLAERERAA